MKKILIGIGVTVVLLVTILVAAPFFIPKKVALGYLTQAVEKSLPLHLTLDDVSLTLFPFPGISLKNVSAAIVKDGAPSPFFEMGSLKASTRWSPLLAKHFVISLSTEKIAVHLNEDSKDHWNYQTLIKPDEKKEPSKALEGWVLEPNVINLQDTRITMKTQDGKAQEFGVKKFLLDQFKYEETADKRKKFKAHLEVDGVTAPDLHVKGVAVSGEISIPVSGEPHISGSLSTVQVKSGEYVLSEIRTKFDAEGKQFQLKDFSVNVMEGTAGGDVALNLSGKIPSYQFHLNVKDIEIAKLSEGMVSGKTDAVISGKGEGFEQAQWSQTLDATGNFSVTHVTSQKVDAFKSIFQNPIWSTLKAIPGTVDEKAIEKIEGLDTSIEKIASDFIIQNGVLQLKDLRVPFPDAALAFHGGIGLDKKIDLSGDLSLEKPLVDSLIHNEGLRSSLVNQNQALSIPLRITGDTSHPTVTPDFSALQSGLKKLAVNRAKEEAKKILAPVKEEIQKKIQENIPANIPIHVPKMPKLPF